jgi:hypothetical protein
LPHRVRHLLAGAEVTRLQVVNAESIRELGSPPDHLLAHLPVTHAEKDQLVMDGGRDQVLRAALRNGATVVDDDGLVDDLRKLWQDMTRTVPPASASATGPPPPWRSWPVPPAPACR